MILSDVEETITTVEIDEETYEELFKVNLSTIESNNYKRNYYLYNLILFQLPSPIEFKVFCFPTYAVLVLLPHPVLRLISK